MTLKNLVLAGGGAKGLAYVGVARALEERDILKNVLRFEGNNTGSIIAALFSVGFNSYDVEALMPVTMELLYRDSKRLIKKPNSHGWRPSEKFKKYMGDVLALKTKNLSITFEQLHSSGKELCIMATTEETKEEKTYDWKTSAHMEIREAICKSLYIPAELQPDKKKCQYGDEKKRFLGPGETFRCLTYSDNTHENPNKKYWPRDSKLSSSDKRQEKVTTENVNCVQYLGYFVNAFRSKKEFSLEEFKTTFEKIEKLARLYPEMMYGLDVDAETLYNDIKQNGNLTAKDLDEFERKNQISFQVKHEVAAKNLNAAKEKIVLNEEDVASTIDINTGYICESDFLMDDCDRKFLIDEGKRSTEKFLLDRTCSNKPSLTAAEIAKITCDWKIGIYL